MPFVSTLLERDAQQKWVLLNREKLPPVVKNKKEKAAQDREVMSELIPDSDSEEEKEEEEQQHDNKRVSMLSGTKWA
jgi:hypothetical protein